MVDLRLIFINFKYYFLALHITFLSQKKMSQHPFFTRVNKRSKCCFKKNRLVSLYVEKCLTYPLPPICTYFSNDSESNSSSTIFQKKRTTATSKGYSWTGNMGFPALTKATSHLFWPFFTIFASQSRYAKVQLF